MPSFQLSPGVVVDPDRREAYVMSPEGGIDAVGLTNGTPIWHTGEADKPLTVAGELLVGQSDKTDQANVLTIVAMDTHQAGAPVSETRVELPPEVVASVSTSLAGSFTAKAVPETTDAVISWEFVDRPLRGLPPGPLEVLPGEISPAVSASAAPVADAVGLPSADPPVEPGGGVRVVRGTARVELSTGAVRASQESRVPTVPGLAPAPATEAASAPDLPPAEALPGVPQPQFLSADGHHVMSSQRIANDPEWDKYLCSIFERDTGRRVGELRMHLRYVPFFVSDDRLIYQTPPYERLDGTTLQQEPVQLRAADLNTGAPVWQQEVRDTVDREPPPP